MKKGKLAKNTVFYTIALSIQRVLTLAYIVFLARAIGVENMGRLSLAMSFTTIFAIFLDFGLNQIIIRESARDNTQSQKNISNAIGLKIIGSVAIYLALFIGANIMSYSPLVKNMIYLAGLVMIIDSFALNFYGTFRGHHLLKYESWGVILNQLAVISFGVVAVYFNLGLVYLVGAYLLGSGFNFLFSSGFLRRRLKIRTIARFDWPVMKHLLVLSIPFAIAGIFVRMYSNLDIVLLSKMTSDFEVGLYSVAYKASFAFQFIGLAVLAVVYPAFCHYFVSDKKKLQEMFMRVFSYLMMVSVPIAVGTILVAKDAMLLVFGPEYLGSVLALQIMMISIPISYFCFPLGAMLNASNRQVKNTIFLGITAASSLVFNLILIPMYGHQGSAIAIVLSYLVLFTTSILAVVKVINFDYKFFFTSLFRVLASVAVMAIAVWYLKSNYHIIVTAALGALVYFVMLYVVGGYSKGEMKALASIITKK